MNEVAWDLPKHYPPVEPPAAAWGEVRAGLVHETAFIYVEKLNKQTLIAQRYKLKKKLKKHIRKGFCVYNEDGIAKLNTSLQSDVIIKNNK